MAIEKISHQTIIRLPRPVVWRSMLDPDILAQCIAGCEQLVLDSDWRYRATVRYKAGPLTRVFKGTVMLTDIVPERSLRFRRGSYKPFEGSGAFSGSARLADHPDGTELTIDAEMEAPATILKLVKLISPMGSKTRLKEYVTQFQALAAAKSL